MKNPDPFGVATRAGTDTPRPLGDDPRPVLITGGAGFIGTNVADRLLRGGHSVILYDNLSRAGVERNAAWLEREHGKRVRVHVADVRDAEAIQRVVSGGDGVSHVFHFAAQVAVTTSLDDPRDDFETNLRGTLNVLEAVRAMPKSRRPPLLFTSTNKVYGDLHGLYLEEADNRYRPTDPIVKQHGFAEGWLDFHSPYGCSKGAADQYVLDYSRSYGLRNVVFRMSCIYGPHQCGTEDQGWLAHFLMRAMRGDAITLYGDGKQVRDVLFVEDLVQAMTLAMRRIDDTAAHAFNMGGGPANTISLLECLRKIGEIRGRQPAVAFGAWRRGDQKYYVSDTRLFQRVTGWSARTPVDEGMRRLHDWLEQNARPAASATAQPAEVGA